MRKPNIPTVMTLRKSYHPSLYPVKTRTRTIVTMATTTAVEATICACSTGPNVARNLLILRMKFMDQCRRAACASRDAEGLPRKVLRQDRIDFLFVAGLQKIICSTQFTRNFLVVKIVHGRYKHHGLGSQLGKFLDMVQEVKAVHIRHPHIQQNQVRLVALEGIESISSACRLFDDIPLCLEHLLENSQPNRLIVNNQDLPLWFHALLRTSYHRQDTNCNDWKQHPQSIALLCFVRLSATFMNIPYAKGRYHEPIPTLVPCCLDAPCYYRAGRIKNVSASRKNKTRSIRRSQTPLSPLHS